MGPTITEPLFDTMRRWFWSTIFSSTNKALNKTRRLWICRPEEGNTVEHVKDTWKHLLYTLEIVSKILGKYFTINVIRTCPISNVLLIQFDCTDYNYYTVLKHTYKSSKDVSRSKYEEMKIVSDLLRYLK